MNAMRALALLLAVLLAGALGPPVGVAADLGVPADGEDLVLLKDGRVVRCRAGEPEGGKTPLAFTTETLWVASDRIAEIRYFRDYDSTPRDEGEQKKVDAGLVRFAGEWMDPDRAASLRERELAKMRKQRDEDEKHFQWENRWQLETKHFAIQANITKADLDYYSGLVEAFYEHFTRSFKIKLTARERKAKLPVFLYRQREEYWKHYQEDTGGEGEHTSGYFVPVPGHEKLVLHARPGTREETKDVLLHEGTHYILHLANPQVLLPRWVHEGCAEYFGASSVEGSDFKPGLVQDGRLLHFQEMIRTNKIIPFDDLFRAGNRVTEGAATEFKGEHYAQAWTFVHFLMHYKDGKYRSAFSAYLARWISGRGLKYVPITATDRKFIDAAEDRAQLLRSLRHRDFERLREELIEYAGELTLRGAWAYVERGQMRYWNEGRSADAQDDFDRALRHGGDDPEVLIDLARAYSRIPGKQGEVVPLLQSALDRDPLDVRARLLMAVRLPEEKQVGQLRICERIESDNARVLGHLAWRIYKNQIAAPFRATSEKDRNLAADARAIAERAVAIDPEHFNYDTLSAMHILHGDFEKACEMSTRAVQQEPEGSGYLERQACAYAMLDDAMECAKALRRLEIILRREGGGRDLDREGEMRIYRGLEGIAECAVAWDKPGLAVKAFDAWYERRDPRTEMEWVLWAALLTRDGDRDRALGVARKGLAEHEGSKVLANVVKKLEE